MYAALVFILFICRSSFSFLYSFNRDGVGGFPPRHFTLDWYRQLFADAPHFGRRRELPDRRCGSVALALVLGLLAALALIAPTSLAKHCPPTRPLPLILSRHYHRASLLMFARFRGRPA